MQVKKESKRGAYRRADCVLLAAWFPNSWVEQIDREVVRKDSDRSKILRAAVREKFAKEAA